MARTARLLWDVSGWSFNRAARVALGGRREYPALLLFGAVRLFRSREQRCHRRGPSLDVGRGGGQRRHEERQARVRRGPRSGRATSRGLVPGTLEACRANAVIDLSRISSHSLAGRVLRAPLRLVPGKLVVPVVQGPLRGARWVVGSSTHGCWLGCYEAGNQAIYVRLVRPGMTVYDLGAHVGFYTLLFSRLVGPGGVVHAFEPVPRNIFYLERHLRLNGTMNVRVQEFAVTRQTGHRLI